MAGGHGEVKVGFQWWASPTAIDAEILVPALSAPAARRSVRRYHDGFTLKRRARSWAAEILMRTPMLPDLLLRRGLVTVDGQVNDGLLSHLAEFLAASRSDLQELHVAVSLSRPKSNRKPVLQLLDQNGSCLGWAKIGWNEWTSKLLGNEAGWLQAIATHPLHTPSLVDDLMIGDARVVITTGAEASRLPRRERELDTTLLLAIADLGSRGRVRLSESPWWASVEAVRPAATPAEAAAIDQVAAVTDDLRFDIGAWHGDLTPWNILSTGGSGRRVAQVIDWEFAADGVPLGFDLCHYHTQVASEMKGMSADRALDHSARLSPQGLAALGVDPHNQIGVYRLYLVELIRRTLALRVAGIPVDDVKQGAAAVRRIRADLLRAPSPIPTTEARV